MSILNKIQQELKAPKNQKNSFGNYKYRSCEDILEAVKPLLGDATLTLSDEIVCFAESSAQATEKYLDKNGLPQIIRSGGSKIYVKATATLKDGDVIETATAYAREADNKKGMDEAQITGSASSYARKYALNGLFLIDDTKDSDATNKHGKDVMTKADKLATVTSLFKYKEFDEGAFFRSFDVSELSELNEVQLDKAIDGLQKKKNKGVN